MRFFASGYMNVLAVKHDQKGEHKLHELNSQALGEKVLNVILAEVVSPLILHGQREECARIHVWPIFKPQLAYGILY